MTFSRNIIDLQPNVAYEQPHLPMGQAASDTNGKQRRCEHRYDYLISHETTKPLSWFNPILVVWCQPASFANASPLPRKSRWRPQERSPKSRLRPFRLVTPGSARCGPR